MEAFEGMNVPEGIKRAALHICNSYGIRGSADPGYIANVIAEYLGRGDGRSNFDESDPFVECIDFHCDLPVAPNSWWCRRHKALGIFR